MKRRLAALLALCCAALCAACSAQQPPEGLIRESAPDAVPIEAEPDAEAALQFAATLYFAYGDTPLMRREVRQITLPPNESREKALVSALLEGSREAGSRALFPEKTQVLSTLAQDGVIYVTFNEALYGRYGDEGAAEQSRRRRRLALDALTATLTESGEYAAVQVLVRAEENVGGSMRLTSRFLKSEKEEILPPLTRQCDSLPTPAAYARELLTAWQNRSGEDLAAFVSVRDNQSAASLSGALAGAPALLSFAVYDGTVSPDGGSAVVCADLTLRDADGMESAVDACPLRLVSEGGAWKIRRAQLARIMGENDE